MIKLENKMSINFSVLMSLYAKEKPEHLAQCLLSLTEQILSADEIVLVFDGEIGDELRQVVHDFSDKLPLNIVKLSKNVGLGKALNAGLQQCRHEWVFRMDTDDICVRERFQKQMDFIQKNSDIVLFGGQVLEFDENQEQADTLKSVPVENYQIKQFSQKRNPFNHMTVAYKKDIILKLGGYQHHLFMEDYNLWLRVIGAGYKVANLSDVLVYARVGNGMHARRRGWQYIQSEKQLLDLKLKLKIQPIIPAVMLFLARSFTRLLPAFLLQIIYNFLLRK